MRRRWCAGWVLLAALAFGPAQARADGAFPNGQSILVPADRPDEIVLATNFGLITTEDGGRSWIWTCEQPVTSYGHLYQLGPAPADRLFAVANGKLVFSDDGACGWQAAGGALSAELAEDAFVDPTDGARVLVAALAPSDAGTIYSLLESTDGGATFAHVLYTTAPGDLLTGVEIARSAPMTIVLALSHGPAAAPTLARSTDGGLTWALTDLFAALGPGQLGIVAIDPLDADRVFLRRISATGDALVLATGGGASVTTSLALPGGTLVAFARTSAGTLLAAATRGAVPALYRSIDGGATFAAVAGAPAILALAARGGTVYAATDTTLGPAAEAISTDDGLNWQPGLTFAQIAAVAPCLAHACRSDCAARAAQNQWPATLCTAAAPPDELTDGGLDGPPPDATAVGPKRDDAASRLDAGDVIRPGGPASGCACATGGGGCPGAVAFLFAAALLSRRRRG